MGGRREPMDDVASLQSGRCRVVCEGPTTLAAASGDAVATFERLWSCLREFDGTNAFCFLDEDGGLFLKGQRLPDRVTPSAVLQSRRMLREVENLRALRAAGLPVPQVVLHGVERRFGVPTRSLVVLRRLEGSMSLREVLKRTSAHERAGLWEAVGRVVAAMHRIGFVHRDLTARNILVQRADGDFGVHLIDCPRGEFAGSRGRFARLRREDHFRLGRSVLDLGGAESEVRALFAATGFDEADRAMAMIDVSRRAGGARPLRTKFWVAFGV